MEPPDKKNVDFILGRVRKYRCEYCGLDYTMQRDLKIHLLNIHGLTSHSCPVCNELFYAEGALEEHKKSVHGGQMRHHCTLCSRSYKSVIQLEYHVEYKHKIEEAKFCSECGQQFFNSFALKRHLQLLHKPHHIYYDCHKCKRSFKRPHILKQHMLFDHWKSGKKHALEYIDKHDIMKGLTEDAHKCKPCNLTFDSSVDLIYHLKNDHRKKVGKFSCCQCDAVYPLRSSLSVHMRHDHKLVGHTCEKCPPTKIPREHRPMKTKIKLKKEVQPRVYADRAYKGSKKQAPWIIKYIREKIPSDLSLKNVKEEELSNLRHNIKIVFNVLSTVPTSRLRASVGSRPVHRGPTKVVLGQNVDILEVMFPPTKSHSVPMQMESDRLGIKPLKSSDKPNIDSTKNGQIEIEMSPCIGASNEKQDVGQNRKRKTCEDVADECKSMRNRQRNENAERKAGNKSQNKEHLFISKLENPNKDYNTCDNLNKMSGKMKSAKTDLSKRISVNFESNSMGNNTTPNKTGSITLKDLTKKSSKSDNKSVDPKQRHSSQKGCNEIYNKKNTTRNIKSLEIVKSRHSHRSLKMLKNSQTSVVSKEDNETGSPQTRDKTTLKYRTKSAEVLTASKSVSVTSPVTALKKSLHKTIHVDSSKKEEILKAAPKAIAESTLSKVDKKHLTSIICCPEKGKERKHDKKHSLRKHGKKDETKCDVHHNKKKLSSSNSLKEMVPTACSKSEIKECNIIKSDNVVEVETIQCSLTQDISPKTNKSEESFVCEKEIIESNIAKISVTSGSNFSKKSNESPNQTPQSSKYKEKSSENHITLISMEKTSFGKSNTCDDNSGDKSVSAPGIGKVTQKDINKNKQLGQDNVECKEHNRVIKSIHTKHSSRNGSSGDSAVIKTDEKLKSKPLDVMYTSEKQLKSDDSRVVKHSLEVSSKSITERNAYENKSVIPESSVEKEIEKIHNMKSSDSHFILNEGSKPLPKPTFKATTSPYIKIITQPKELETDTSLLLYDGETKIPSGVESLNSSDLSEAMILKKITDFFPISPALTSMLEEAQNFPSADDSNDINITSNFLTNENIGDETQLHTGSKFSALTAEEDTFKKVIVERIETDIVSPPPHEILHFCTNKELDPTAVKFLKSPKVIKMSSTPKIKLSPTIHLTPNPSRKLSHKLALKLTSNNNESSKKIARNLIPLLDTKQPLNKIGSLHEDIAKTSNEDVNTAVVVRENNNTVIEEPGDLLQPENLCNSPKTFSPEIRGCAVVLDKIETLKMASKSDTRGSKEMILKFSSLNRMGQNKLQRKSKARNLLARKRNITMNTTSIKPTSKISKKDFEEPQHPKRVILTSLEKKAIIDKLLAKATPILDKKLKEKQLDKPVPIQVGQVVKPMQKTSEENVKIVIPQDSGTKFLVDDEFLSDNRLVPPPQQLVVQNELAESESIVTQSRALNLTDNLNANETLEGGVIINNNDKSVPNITPTVVDKVRPFAITLPLKSKTKKFIVLSKDALSKNVILQSQVRKTVEQKPSIRISSLPTINDQSKKNLKKVIPIKIKMLPKSTTKISKILVGNEIPTKETSHVVEHKEKHASSLLGTDIEDSIPSYLLTSKKNHPQNEVVDNNESDMTNIKILSQTLDDILCNPCTEESTKDFSFEHENSIEELKLTVDSNFCQIDCDKNDESFEIANYVDIETTNSPNTVHSKSPNNVYSCKSCIFSCLDEISLLNHLTEFHANDSYISSYKCSLCDKEFESQDEYDTHIENDHSIECTKCGNHFENYDFDNHKCIKNKEANINVKTSSAVDNVKSKQRDDRNTMEIKQAEVLEHLQFMYRDAIKPKKEFRFSVKAKQNFERKQKKSKRAYCDVCQIKFTTCLLLYNHNRIYHKDTHIFKCEKCHTEFMRNENLKRHNCKLKTSFWCTKCNLKFTNRDEATEHKRAKHNLGSLKCDYCYKYFKSNKNLVKHMYVKHANRLDNVQFPIMKKFGRGDSTIYDDLEIINQAAKSPRKVSKSNIENTTKSSKSTSPQKTVYKCPICLEPFPDKPTVFAHMSAAHDIKDPSKNVGPISNSRNPFQNIADYKACKTSENAKTQVMKFKCSKCHITLSSKTRLVKHIQQSHKLKITKKVYRCHRCNSIFTLQDKFKLHMKIKHGFKVKLQRSKSYTETQTTSEIKGNMHKCKQCGAFLPSNDSLQRHMQWEHMKVHKCGHCGEVLDSAEEFLRHLISGHANDKIKEVMPESRFKWKTKLANKHEKQGE